MFALVTNIQGYSIHDGPGIRTVVFLKGCGLKCQWCSNPECISARPEIGFFKSLCNKCGKCLAACPEKAISGKAGALPEIDRQTCSGCGKCASICYSKALVAYGQATGAEAIFDSVRRDKMFYQASGGGVTVSGGEALLQPQLVEDLFERCRQAGIHTCIETSGFAAESALRQVLRYTDYVLYDLKLIDSARHLRYTGQANPQILSNARVVAESGVEFLFRMPLIPGVNDDAQNIKDTACELKKLGKMASRIELMPYHRLGAGKYESLGQTYPLAGLVIPESGWVEQAQKVFEVNGITCTISK